MAHNRIILLLAALALCACSVTKPVVEYRDSIVFRERIVHDTALFEIPVEVEKIVTRDTASHLENRYGESDAVVSGGFLSHSLKTKPQTIKVPVDVPVHDTLIVHSEAQIIHEVAEVEKPLSCRQRLKIGAFWWLVALAVVGWRRELINLIKLLLKLF